MREMVGGCCVCSDERGWPDNPLVYCDGIGCNVAVHQACYGIVAVPVGPWFCRKCESPENKGKVKCDLCPSKSGALKHSDSGGWAHVVCALYIPEVRFGNVTSMEPIVLRLIPPERYNKVCYICQEQGKSNRANAGACMPCNKSGCKQQFHVTCAQSLGLLCEEAGNYLDNVKYCGYCQHHYSKLKKGGNVKPIPPYKPASLDGNSSDSSPEKEGNSSPMASGSGTPTQASKAKGAGRKSSHGAGTSGSSGKSTPNAAKTPTHSSVSNADTGNESPDGVSNRSRKHKSSDKSGKIQPPMDKTPKKPSPSPRRQSANEPTATITSGSLKNNTPAPSPQHTTTDSTQSVVKAPSGGSSKVASNLSASSPNKPQQESVGVISSVASATASAAEIAAMSTPAASVVLATNSSKPVQSYQESVITNLENMENKQTKKRKAANAAASLDYSNSNNPPATVVTETPMMWEPAVPAEIHMEPVDVSKTAKKTKNENQDVMPTVLYPNIVSVPLPPPCSPVTQPSARHLPSPNTMPGPSGINMSNIRSPSQAGKSSTERDGPTSLVVSVPLPSTSQGLNLSAHAQMPGLSDNRGPSPHIFHQLQKHIAMEQSLQAHSSHTMPARTTWGGLNVSYEMQHIDMSKSSGIPSVSKEPMPSTSGMNHGVVRNKKRAAMNASVVAMANTTTPTIQTPQSQVMGNMRRPPLPTPPPIYQETIQDSPPISPGTERMIKPKDKSGAGPSAPHMLGNELNPESGAAARLQEQLTAELAAHAAGGSGSATPLLPAPLLNRTSQGLSMAGARSSTSSAQSLDQLLERQWDQGSQFLMEQAQHFDIASLLSCLHQLRTENVRLEEHVGSLLQRRDHLLAVNARLAIPLSVANTAPTEPMRCPRDNGAQIRPPQAPMRQEPMAAERAHQIMDQTYVQLMMREVQQKPS